MIFTYIVYFCADHAQLSYNVRPITHYSLITVAFVREQSTLTTKLLIIFVCMTSEVVVLPFTWHTLYVDDE